MKVTVIKKYSEPVLWAGALLLLFFMNPAQGGHSLCVLKALGANWCPGCGLGHAIHFALHLNIKASMEEHILGIPAAIILLYQIFKSIYLTHKKYNNEPAKNFTTFP